MKKVILVILLIFLTACSSFNTSLLPKGDEEKDKISLTGTNGMVLMEIFYPKESSKIIDSISFSPIINLRNTGSYNSNGQVCISGLDPSLFSGSSSCDCLTYSFDKLPEEKSYESQSLSFGPYSINTENDVASNQALTVINKYDYQSVSYFKPCIKQKNDFGDCLVKTISSANGPLYISSITEVLTPHNKDTVQLAFDIELQNIGPGKVINVNDVISECSFKPDKNVIVQGTIEDIPVIGDVQCQDAIVKDNKANLHCIVGDVNLYDRFGNYIFEKEFETPSKLTVAYGYEDFDSVMFNL